MSGSTGAVPTRCNGVDPPEEGGFGVSADLPGWERVDVLELGPLPTAVGCGRDHAKQVLIEWGLKNLVDDVILLVSELLTNALQASWALKIPTPIVLRLLANDQQFVIEAWDQWVESFDLISRRSDDEHGRGLTVVAALSRRWGVVRISEDYKAVWCEIVIDRQ
jgi:anti-sigma regulatory factor (Ser/Thr protein kinase)